MPVVDWRISRPFFFLTVSGPKRVFWEFLILGQPYNGGPRFWFVSQCGRKEMTTPLLII